MHKLGAPNTYLRQTVRGQITRVFKAPVFVGALLICAFYLLILFGNGEGGITPYEWAALGSCTIVAAAISVLLYGLCRFILASVYGLLGIRKGAAQQRADELR